MSAPYIIPFNHQPVNSAVLLNTGYTVPSGKYSRVVVILNAMTRISASTRDNDGGEYAAVSTNSSTVSIEMWLRAGEVVTVSNSTASSGASATSLGSSSASFSVAGVQAGIVYAPCVGLTGGGGSDDTTTMSGDSSVSIRYEEHNIIT